MDYAKIRTMVGKRICFSYDTGARIVGVLQEIRPAVGLPEMVILKDADVISSGQTVLGHHQQLTVVPNSIQDIREHEVPSVAFRTPQNL